MLFLIPISISSFIYKATFFKSEKNYVVYLNDLNLSLDLDDYLIGVVAAEMPALFEYEALKAQVVAARSFALSSALDNKINITASVNDQAYLTNYELKEKWQVDYEQYYQKIKEAVNSTKDLVVKRDKSILKTYYFSMSNGYTENSQTVFNENTFSSVESPLENENLKNFTFVKTISKNEFLEILNISEFNIQSVLKNQTNHVDKIKISDKEFTGVEIRKMLNLRSTDFEFAEENNEIKITTKGYGHGVGMSQYGANEMAKTGYSFEEILLHYYKNTEISKI